MRRRLLLFLTLFFAGLTVMVLTLPLWFGAALGALGPKWGIRFGRYERLSYARFALHDAEYQRGNVRVTATRIEGDTPVFWLSRRWISQPGEVIAERWSVVVEAKTETPANSAGSARPANGWVPLRRTLQKISSALDRWVPRVRSGAGSVQWPGGGLSLAAMKWEKTKLTTNELVFGPVKADATLEFQGNTDLIRFTARTPDGSVEMENRAADVAGNLVWWEQRAPVTARFGEQGWLPADASLKAEGWNVPGSRFKVGELYSTVRGSARIEWREQQLSGDVEFNGEPLAGKKAPPLQVAMRGHGSSPAFTMETLRVALPGITATLSEPVTVERSGRFRESAARFSLQADLAKQSWFSASGTVSGEARLTSGVAQSPVVEFRLESHEVAAQGLEILSSEMNGRFDWPRLVVTAGNVVGRQGERMQWHGGWDFRAKQILDASIEGQLRRSTLARWLPAQPMFDIIAIKGEASGGIEDAKHVGEVRVDHVSWSGLKPLSFALDWTGHGTRIDRFSAAASAGATKLTAGGVGDRDGVTLNEFDLSQGADSRLRLTQPMAIRWRPVLQVEGLRLAGAQGAIDANITWGAAGRIGLAVRNVPSTWLSDIVTLPGPAWDLNSLALEGAWDRGPLTFSAVTGVAIGLGEGRKAVINLSARGDGKGVRLDALRAAEGAQSIVNATGIIPITFAPGTDKLVTLDSRATLAIDADSVPNAAFWSELAAITGFELIEPRVAAHIRGSWERPEGDVRLEANKIAVDAKRFARPLPTIESLDVALIAASDAVRLEKFSLRVEGQAVTASGRLPIGDGGWEKLVKEPLSFARRDAELRLEIPDAEVAVFARFLPAYLAPKGRLHVDLNYRGGDFDGSLRLNDAATRPLGPLGVLQEIQADLRLAGRAMELRSVTAKSGGEEVRLTGRIELPPAATGAPADAKAAAPQPKFDLAMKGENLPFVRQTGLLVRGDLDLKLVSTERGVPKLTGTVHMRDSLFLQDLRALLPGGARSKTRRPPYFAVENPPLDAWQLDVNVEGDRFMRLRTAVFNGVASARFHLGGTLGEPFALGDASIDEGRVRLPFATFDVQEGRGTLTREQPYEPQLWVAGTARRYNYDLRMELSGPASAPVLTFSSTPPLDHGQVLLMVMAGEAPRDEVTYSDRQRAAGLGAFVGQSLLASFGDSDDADRLTIASGEKVSRQGRETYDLEYRLSNRWSVTGEYDEFDEYNAGVKWRAYSKGGQPDDRTKNEAGKP